MWFNLYKKWEGMCFLMKKNQSNNFIYDEKGVEVTMKQLLDSYCSGEECVEKAKKPKKK